MQRKAPPSRSGSKTEDIKQDLSANQLQGIGSVAIAWNEVEFMLDCVIYSGLVLSGSSWLDVLTRLSTDAKIDLIPSAEETLSIPPVLRETIQSSVKSTKDLKELRNSVVHARIFDAPKGIGENIRRGGKIWQVLLVESALECLYNRLIVLHRELRSILAIFDLFRTGCVAVNQGIMTWEQLVEGKEVVDWTDRLNELQNEQAALAKAMPGFKRNSTAVYPHS